MGHRREHLVAQLPVRQIHHDGLMRLQPALGGIDLLKVAKHGPGAHMVAVYKGHRVVKVLCVIDPLGKNRAVPARFPRAVVVQIELVVPIAALEDGVADVRLRYVQPGLNIRIHLLQGSKIHRAFIDRRFRGPDLEILGERDRGILDGASLSGKEIWI